MKNFLYFLVTVAMLGLSSSVQSQVVPEGAYTKVYDVDYLAIPQGFSAAAFWLQAATIENVPGQTAKIYVDYMTVIRKNLRTGKESIIENFKYDKDETFTKDNGGFYDRVPVWFGNSDHHVPMGSAAQISTGNLIFDVGKHSDVIFHWWSSRFETSPDYNYILEIRYKVEGVTALSIGFDHWRDLYSEWNGFNVNNKQAFVSDWYGDTNGEFKTIREPLIR